MANTIAAVFLCLSYLALTKDFRLLGFCLPSACSWRRRSRTLCFSGVLCFVGTNPQGNLTTCLGWKDNNSLPITVTHKLSEILREENGDPHFGILHRGRVQKDRQTV